MKQEREVEEALMGEWGKKGAGKAGVGEQDQGQWSG